MTRLAEEYQLPILPWRRSCRMPKYLIRFAQIDEKNSFRLPELEALCTINKISISYDAHAYSDQSPLMVVVLPNDDAVRKILERAILIKDVSEFIGGSEVSVDDLHASVKANLPYFKPFEHTSFKFDVDSYGMSMMHEDKLDLIYSFAYTELKGEVKLSGAEITYTIKLDHNNKRFFLGRLIGEGRRDLCEKFSLKAREYIGITSMEAELSLVMSNLGLVGPGQIVLDPFVGTGSFLYTTSAFGAYSIGCDIDGRQLRGDGEGSFRNNLVQYNIEQLVLGALVSDLKHHPWRKGMKFDSIITDPPYGVRAGAKKIGGFDFSRPNKLTKDPMERAARYPKTVPYELADLVADLYDFAADFLKVGGRLVFWYPVDKGTRIGFTKEMLPTDPRFHQVAACCQSLRDFDRWLIVASLL